MEVPDGFFVIESGLFRAKSAPDFVFPFLSSLNLKTIIVLDSGTPSRTLTEFAADNDIKLVHLVLESWRSVHDIHRQRLMADTISSALELVLDSRCYPIFVLGSNILTGVIRKLENWSLFSVLNEYNAYSELTNFRPNPAGSVFLEFSDFVYSDDKDSFEQSSNPGTTLIRVTLPEIEFRPDWVRRFEIGADSKS